MDKSRAYNTSQYGNHLSAVGTISRAYSRNEPGPLASRWEGIEPMGILCADSAVRAMDNQLGLLVRANDAPAIYSIALCRRNE